MGKLISLEACDAAGKSTQIQLIKDYYELQNKKVKHLHFPMYGHNEFSNLISMFLQGKFGNNDIVNPYFIANIYAMDRFMYKEQLIKDLFENDVVILDRYVFSNISFQCAKIQDKNKRIELLNWIKSFEFDFLGLPYPDLVIFINLPISEIERRLNKVRKGDDRKYLEDNKDIHESDINFQNEVNNIYLSLKGVLNYHIVDGFNDDNILSIIELFNQYKPIL